MKTHILGASLTLALAGAALPLPAAEFQIVVADAAGVGFNDPTPATPVGGNTGTTIGAQRLVVFQEAARVWGALLPSNVTIKVNSSFSALTCTATTAVLGSAGATTVHANFAGAPLANTWYNKPEADKHSGTFLGTNPASINAQFNSELGKTGCLTGTFFYLGLDNNHGSNVNLLTVLLHEFGHGLGFTSAANSSGKFIGSGSNQYPGAFDRFLYDVTAGKTWDQMATDADRVISGTNTGKLAWNGPNPTLYAKAYAGRKPILSVAAPPASAGIYAVGTADFGAPVVSVSVTAPVVVALDAADAAGPLETDACGTITNGSALAGKIALVDRGTCAFVLKAKNVQNAGAVGMIVVDSVVQGVAGMSGSDAAVTIPSVRITLDAGTTLKANLPSSATLGPDPVVLAGTDASGRLLVYAPNPYEGGSSVSHFDTSAFPNLLMEPNISSDLPIATDATLSLFRDIGWFEGSTTLPTTWVLPSSAHAQGANGAFYKTDLTVSNTGAAAANLTLKFLGHDGDGRTGAEVTRVVQAGQTVTYTDVLASLFGVSSGFGAIRINADTNNLRVVSQTSTPPPSGIGTFGQAVPAATGNDFVTTAAAKALFSLRQDAAFRTNAVIANATEAAAHIDLALFNASGVQIGSGSADLNPLEMRQISGVVTNLGGPDGTKDAFLVVSTTTADARIATYAAVIDQTTNDPRTILPATLGTLGTNGAWVLPSTAHAQGANNAFYTTDLTIGNAGTAAATVTLKFLGHDQDGSGGTEVIKTVPANSVATYTDVLGSVFGVSSGFGAIHVTSNSQNLKVLSQTSTPPPNLVGTFGQSVPAAGAADFVTLAAPKTLVGLRQDASFRTNAVVANATAQPTHVDLVLRSEGGATIGSGSADLLPYEMRQISAVVTTLGAPDGTANAALVVSTTTAGARIATYAAIIDQKTNDPRTVLP
ncbi:MAG: PA domain-containing protein [Acidobacteriota bacterium]